MSDRHVQPVDRESVHSGCVVCDPKNARGLNVSYRRTDGGAVEAEFDCDDALHGYEGRLHGGIIAALLDGAMTHCLFACGVTAVTAVLDLTYRRPVAVGGRVTIRAWQERDMSPLHLMRAELVQDAEVKASASAKFMRDDGGRHPAPGR